jgi:guanylate kinase
MSVYPSPLMSPAQGPSHRLPTDTDDADAPHHQRGPAVREKRRSHRGVERTIPDAVFSVSATTREKTNLDVDGVDYHFVSDEEFERMKAADEFLETAGVYGRKYGTPRKWVDTHARTRVASSSSRSTSKVPSPSNARSPTPIPSSSSRRATKNSSAVCEKRKREDENGIQKRFGKAREEMARARSCGVYDVFITNRDLDAAIAQAIEMVRLERARRRGLK